MKKLISMALLAVSVSAFAQDDKLMLTSREETNIGYYSVGYAYNAAQMLDTLICVNEVADYKSTYHYDEDGLLVSVTTGVYDGFTWIDNAEVTYAYDEQGRKIERRNYNFVNGLKPDYSDGIINYGYDADGNMLYSKTYVYMGKDENEENAYMYSDSTAYIYSQSRLTKKETWNVRSGEISQFDAYTYTAKGYLESATTYFPYNGVDEPYSKELYGYDRKGNMTYRNYYLANSAGQFRTVQDSISYIYDTDVDFSSIVYGVDPEEIAEFEKCMQSKIDMYEKYVLEEYTGNLGFTECYEFTYAPFKSSVAETAMGGDKDALSVFVHGGTLFVLGNVDRNAQAVITDMDGRVRMNATLNNGILDVYSLGSGLYILSVDGQSVKFRK